MQTYSDHHGHTAEVLGAVEDRVVYRSYDTEGNTLQEFGCVSSDFFFKNWSVDN